jgi:hypothetical protein
MTFYRLRRAIRKLGADGDYGPSSKIRFLEENGVKASFGKMEVETGLQLPKPSLMWVGVSGCLVLFLSLFVAFILLTFFHQPLLSGAIGACVAASIVGYAIFRIDPGKLPRDCETLGGLAKKTASLNFGRLIKLGASRRDIDIWNNMIDLLSDYALPRSEINRETFFLQTQLIKASAQR